MPIKIIAGFLLAIALAGSAAAADFERDTIRTSGGELAVTFIGHGTLMFEYGGRIIHVDPWSVLADYASLPRADLVLLTHHHIDHLDSLALFLIRRPDTVTIGTPECARKIHGVRVMRNGDTAEALGIKIEAVPAYNFTRPDRTPVHPRGQCNGYILTFGDTRVYLAGETENIPDLALVRNIDIAFVAMDGVFNMTPEAAAEAVKVFHPRVVYPVHYGASDLSPFAKALEGTGIEVRIRKMR
jgi:L-ascorbate metabolism protein UlaG (beta-lactamase superfamily)